MALMYDGANTFNPQLDTSIADQVVYRGWNDNTKQYDAVDFYNQGNYIGSKAPSNDTYKRLAEYQKEQEEEGFGDALLKAIYDIGDELLVGQNAFQTSALQAQKDEADYNRTWNAEQADLARKFSHDEAEIARQWQAGREDSAYQRLVRDLKSAGLNPILAYQSANPSTGSAQMASTVSASGTQANLSSAKSVDKVSMDDLLPMVLIPLATSAISLLKDISKKEFEVHLF